jgi:steroid delta-isomerase-like uncharacterized protein
MSMNGNKALIQRLHAEGMNRRNPEAAASFYARDASNHGQRIGREGFVRVFTNLFTTFPDWHYTIETCVAEAEWVFCRVTFRGTHRGQPTRNDVFGGFLTGVPPTGKTIEVPHMHAYRVIDGEIVEHRAVRDDLHMLRQLGLIKAPVAEGA